MSLIIIGGSGFIGSRLCYFFLKDQKKFYIYDKVVNPLFLENTIVSDVCNFNSLESIPSNSELIINLAAVHSDDVNPTSLYYDVNVRGAENICKIARLKNINKIIFTSSVAVYGFAPIGTTEFGDIAPFNDYGHSKFEAECVFKEWQLEAPETRTLVIIRPTVVFGENNRGNVYKLLRQISTRFFVMIGNGNNRKSIAYVDNVASFIQHCISFSPGIHIYNYADKPDMSMNQLVFFVKKNLNLSTKYQFKIPIFIGFLIGFLFDILSLILKRKFSISSIRVKKFCSNSVYASNNSKNGFLPPINLEDAIIKTINYEFSKKNDSRF